MALTQRDRLYEVLVRALPDGTYTAHQRRIMEVLDGASVITAVEGDPAPLVAADVEAMVGEALPSMAAQRDAALQAAAEAHSAAADAQAERESAAAEAQAAQTALATSEAEVARLQAELTLAQAPAREDEPAARFILTPRSPDMTDAPSIPTRSALATQRDALNRQLAEGDMTVVEKLEAAFQTEGVAQLRALVSDHYDPAVIGGINQQLGFIKTVLDNVPASLVHIRAGLATTLGSAPVLGA